MKGTGRILEVPVGEGLLGRVVNTLVSQSTVKVQLSLTN
ncbi:ATP synthase alpha chain [Vibrio sp. JCM 19236]|nr:ATP synthase alpha chain [Vibrio sp. JCM 19236]